MIRSDQITYRVSYSTAQEGIVGYDKRRSRSAQRERQRGKERYRKEESEPHGNLCQQIRYIVLTVL